MTNWSIAHDFYYKGVDGGKSCLCRSLGFRRSTAISYSTAIAKVVPRRGFKAEDVHTNAPETGLTLISSNSMTRTTGQHISYVRQSSPFTVVGVPLEMGRYDFTPEDVAMGFLRELEQTVLQLDAFCSRIEFARLMESRRSIMNLACKEWAKPLRDRRFKKYEKLDVEKAAGELKERRRKEAAKAAAETRAVFKKYLPKADAGGADYCEFVRALCDTGYHSEKFNFDNHQANLLRRKLDQNAAYVWPELENDRVRTSKGISVPLDEARVLLKLWASGRDMRTMKIGQYAIVKYEGSEIQIGCHKIPRRNMIALYEAVIGRKFPS